MARALADITQITDLAMIQIRADHGAAGAAIAQATGQIMPNQTRITRKGAQMLGWMSPDELILILPDMQLAPTLAALQTALCGQHALVLDVSDMRAVFEISGARADQVLAKLCPVDVAQLPQDGLRRTRAAQAACAIWRESPAPTPNPVQRLRLMGPRSMTDYLAAILHQAARPGTQLDPPHAAPRAAGA